MCNRKVPPSTREPPRGLIVFFISDLDGKMFVLTNASIPHSYLDIHGGSFTLFLPLLDDSSGVWLPIQRMLKTSFRQSQNAYTLINVLSGLFIILMIERLMGQRVNGCDYPEDPSWGGGPFPSTSTTKNYHSISDSFPIHNNQTHVKCFISR